MWIGCRYYYTESDIEDIFMFGHIQGTYGWEQRTDERLDVELAIRGLRRLGLYRPTCLQIAEYLNGSVSTSQ